MSITVIASFLTDTTVPQGTGELARA